VSTPIGHAIVGLALARRFGVKSRLSLGMTVVAANFADIDVILGILLHRDPWKLHRRRTHKLAFVLSAGALLGTAGLISVDVSGAKRRLFANALAGSIIAGSHLLLDGVSRPQFSARPSVPPLLRKQAAGMSIASWLLDAVVCGTICWAIWPRTRRADRE